MATMTYGYKNALYPNANPGGTRKVLSARIQLEEAGVKVGGLRRAAKADDISLGLQSPCCCGHACLS